MAIDVVAAMRVFTSVVEAESFAGAAEKLDLSRGMATRYVLPEWGAHGGALRCDADGCVILQV